VSARSLESKRVIHLEVAERLITEHDLFFHGRTLEIRCDSCSKGQKGVTRKGCGVLSKRMRIVHDLEVFSNVSYVVQLFLWMCSYALFSMTLRNVNDPDKSPAFVERGEGIPQSPFVASCCAHVWVIMWANILSGAPHVLSSEFLSARTEPELRSVGFEFEYREDLKELHDSVISSKALGSIR
jgi:hypothetical protein